MKVDFHFHLEEGPYSFKWLQRTAQALVYSMPGKSSLLAQPHSIRWMENMTAQLDERLQSGCYSQEWIERYLQLGRERGIVKFGVVDHLYRFKEFKSYYERFMTLDDSPIGLMQREWLDNVCAYSIEEYVDAVLKTGAKHEDLCIGLEADYFVGGEEQLGSLLSGIPLDYVIGSVHYMDGWGFDNPDSQEEFRKFDLLKLYEKHFTTVKRAIGCGLFDFISHLDNLKVFGFRPDEALLMPMYREIALALQEAGLASEINTGLAYRYPIKEMCPSPSFLQLLFEYKVPVTLSSDAHFPDDIGTKIDEAMELARQVGYKEIACFMNRKRYMCPI